VPRKRKCGKCKQIVSDHDARNCPNNIGSWL
jgi:RNA polymerase subunit RPABC4/transcription elongation factor Spt4